MVEVLIRRIERMIDLKGPAGFAESAFHVYRTVEKAGIDIRSAAAYGVYAIPP
jgi:hypothetical protein